MKPKSNPFLRSLRPSLLAVSAVMSLSAFSTQSAFADATWVGDSSQDWNTAANWSSDPANPTGNFTINTATAGVFPIISSNPPFTPVDIFLGTGTGATGRLDQTAGTAATGANNWMFVGVSGGTGTFNLANTAAAGGTFTGFGQGSGSFTAGRLAIGSNHNGGNTGTGTVNMNTSGTLTLNNGNGQSLIMANQTGGTATFNLDNGTIAATGEVWLGTAGTATFNQSGGTISSTAWFVVGRNSGGNGTYNLSGGTVNGATTQANSFPVVGALAGSTGLLNVSGGTFIAGGTNIAPLYIGESGNGTLTQSGGLVSIANTTNGLRMGVNASGTGTVNLNGGILNTPLVSKGSGTGFFNFDGGTLKAAAASANFMTGLTSATILGGGAIIDTNGFDVTIGQDLTDGGGGLTKSGGAGTLTLAGANNYSGTTAVNTGTVAFSTKESTIGDVTVANGTGLRVQNFNPASTTLTSTNLTLGTGGATTLTFDFNSLDSTVPMISTGVLTANGTVSVAIQNPASLTSGNHTLISYSSFAGGGTFSGSPFTLGPRSTGTMTNNTVAKTLVLNVTANAPKWTGLDSGNWVVGTTGANKNWRLITGLTATDYIQGDTVLFDDTAAGNTNIVISAADVTPAATTFNNSTAKSYTLGGAFALSGTGPLTKTGDGSLVVTNANTYTGVTNIGSGATLTLGDGTTGKDGTIAGTSGVANEGTLAFNRFAASTAAYPISGTGAVTVTGSGTQTLSGANSYAGGTTVSGGGKLSIGTNANLGDAAGSLLLNNGTLVTTAGITNTHPITIDAGGGTINVTTNGQLFMNTFDTLLGSGPLNVTGNGTLTASVGNLRVAQTNTYNGPITLNNGGSFEYGAVGAVDAASTFTIGNEGEVAIQNATAMPNAITVTGGTNSVLSFENGGTGEAAGPVTLNANAIIGLRDWYNYATVRSGIISGAVTGAGGLTVNSGTGNGGLLTLSNAANSYAGGTTLNASRVLATSSSALGTGAVTIGGTNARLELGNGVNIANPITINAGAGTLGMGVVWVPVVNEAATVSGPITINANAGAGGHFAANGGTLTVSGQITSSVPVTVRLGTVVLSNTTSSYAGMQVISGTAKVGATNAIPVAVAPILGSGGVTGTLDLGGFNQTLAGVTQSVSANAGSIITNSGGSDSTLTTTGTSTYIGVITNGPTNKVALNVASGALTLGGVNNTFTGNITVSGGLTLADNAQLRFTPGPNTLVNSIGGNGTVNLDGDFVIETAGATVANGNTWTLVNVGTLTETFGATFSVVGFTESANVWTKVEGTNTWTFSEATGVLTLSVGAVSAYNSWATTMGLDGTNNGPTQDNGDFDGVSNALEFVLGGNPKVSDPLVLPDPTVTATDFIFTFNRADESEAEIGLVFEHSTTLASWTAVPIGAASAGVVTVTENGAAPDTVVVTISKASVGNPAKLFGRLKAVK